MRILFNYARPLSLVKITVNFFGILTNEPQAKLASIWQVSVHHLVSFFVHVF